MSTKTVSGAERIARQIHVRGVVQGVGFRPHVVRLAQAHALAGWVRNGDDGVRIHIEGSAPALDAFVRDLRSTLPPAARIMALDVEPDTLASLADFEIRESDATGHPRTHISPDLPVCDDCLRELFDPSNRRYRYPFINCTNCGPRYSIIHALPYDRSRTTMAEWPICAACQAEYDNPRDRRFHAQPIACQRCGPQYVLLRPAIEGGGESSRLRGDAAVGAAAQLLRAGLIVAIKGLGGYHLACDADDSGAVARLRERKYRKDKAFAVMVPTVPAAMETVVLTRAARTLLESPARPIVLASSRLALLDVAPDNRDLGVMLPYTPLHHLLFASGAPTRLVMTSGNRSSEPIAYEDEDASRRLTGLADAFLVGERAIARRVDDSVVRAGSLGPIVLRRSRGLAPGAVTTLPTDRPILALGGDLKSAVALVVSGHAYVSQHIGDLSDHESLRAFDETIRDLIAMYNLSLRDLTIVHDAHPQYASTARALVMDGARTIAVQHHRAHIASVLAEHGAPDQRVLGVAFDGTGYGDDGAIWGGEFFVGRVRDGFERVAHLRSALLPGGDAAARHPVQAAAGFLAQLDSLPDLAAPPFCFPERYQHARAVIRSGVRVFPTTSAGRLFDTAAALCGFTRPITFEGQAAMWLEHLARDAYAEADAGDAPLVDGEIDWRDLLTSIIRARVSGVPAARIARAFHRGLAAAMAVAIGKLADRAGVQTVAISGGVMQNALLLEDLQIALKAHPLEILMNHVVPSNDGGLSLGQAALAVPLIESS